MWPDSWLDDEARARRQEVFSAARTTSHWPDAREVMQHMPHFLGGKAPLGLAADPGLHTPPALDAVGLRLASMEPY